MIPKHFFKTGIALTFFITTGLTSTYGATKAYIPITSYTDSINNNANISVTIDKNTTENNFKDISKTLNEYGITAQFSNIERNNTNELTGIKIRLSDANSATTAGFSSNTPLSQVNFGRKDGSLFITQGDISTNNALSLFGNMPNMQAFGFNQDPSISDMLNGFNLNDFFNDKDGTFSFNGQNLNFSELQKQLQDQFGSDAFWSFFGNLNPNETPFYFIDDPDTGKIIIIDGKESNFETLNKLAKSNTIEAIDYLKPKTAISLYGSKAKDGAIIVTTK